MGGLLLLSLKDSEVRVFSDSEGSLQISVKDIHCALVTNLSESGK